MKASIILPFLLLVVPGVAAAQDAQTFVTNLTDFILSVLIPFLLGMAFFFFIFNVIRYFVAGAGDADGREKARALATYGVLAFVLILVFAGVVNLLTDSLGFREISTVGSKNIAPLNDYQFRGDRPSDCTDGGPC